MATTAILQEMLLLQEVAPVSSFRGRMHTHESLCFAGPIHTLFLGRASPGPLQDGFNLKCSKRTLPAQPPIKKKGKEFARWVSEQLRWLPEILLWKHHEKLPCDCVRADSAPKLLDNYVKKPLLSQKKHFCWNNMASSLPSLHWLILQQLSRLSCRENTIITTSLWEKARSSPSNFW